MSTKRRVWAAVRLAAVLTTACLTLAACSGVPVRDQTPVALPTAGAPYVAPIGDAALEYAAQATLYLPRIGSASLVSVTETVGFSAARPAAESVVRALLAYSGNGVAGALGGEVRLSLYGANPVEVSGDVATVNLAASALQLDRASLYLCGQAIANTLTELPGIRYVNILVMDKQIGLDLGNTLPMGALTRSLGGDMGAAYEQAAAQRVQADEDPAQKRLTVTAALYFPLTAINGVAAEARNVSFTSQAAGDMALRLIRELAEGPEVASGSCALPLLADLLLEPPTLYEPQGGGGKAVALRFDSALYDMLSTLGVPRASAYASLAYTLCTFLPNVTGITVTVGEEGVEHVMLGATEGILFDGTLMRRAHFAPLLTDVCTLYLADAQNTRLTTVHRPVPYYQRTSPRALLLQLFRGPAPEDSAQGTMPVVPAALLTDADILGLSLVGDTLVVNLSDRFRQAGAGISAQQDRLLAYSLTNTLLCDGRATRLYLFVSCKPAEDFTGEIYWAGPFYRNLGLAQP